jgi:hypothetical protein
VRSFSRPFRRRHVGVAQRVLRRIAGLDDDRVLLRQQDHDPHLEHQGDLMGMRPFAKATRVFMRSLYLNGFFHLDSLWCRPQFSETSAY